MKKKIIRTNTKKGGKRKSEKKGNNKTRKADK